MKQLKKQIRESFFNPILYFLPALVFMTFDDFFGVDTAWKVSFPVAVGLIFFVFFRYNRMFVWTGLLSVGYLIIGLLTTVFIDVQGVLQYVDESVFLLLAFFFHTQKKRLKVIAPKTLLHEIPMSNNVNELFRTMKALMIIVGVYLSISLLLDLSLLDRDGIIIRSLRFFYLLSIVITGIFETIRVFIIRARLVNEDWLPILGNEGQVIGSVQYHPDVSPKKRLMHPAVRLYFIEDGKLLLQKRSPKDLSEPQLWDAALSRQVRMSESVDEALRNLSDQLYGVKQPKYLFLTQYIYHGKLSDQFVYLFVSCDTEHLCPNFNKVHQSKWWTKKQIETELGCEVFTERFEREYQILLRSGLLEINGCHYCPLKNTVKEKTIDSD